MPQITWKTLLCIFCFYSIWQIIVLDKMIRNCSVLMLSNRYLVYGFIFHKLILHDLFPFMSASENKMWIIVHFYTSSLIIILIILCCVLLEFSYSFIMVWVQLDAAVATVWSTNKHLFSFWQSLITLDCSEKEYKKRFKN